jgi:cytochrome c oxidase subunit 3
MQPDPGHAATADAHGGYPLAHHFGSPAVQTYAARFGMWLFLSTEVLLFAGLFLAYAIYRYMFPETWVLASHNLLDLKMGTINTIVLISSSLTVALAIHYVRAGKNKVAVGLLVFTLLCAVAFLVIKYFEYSHKFHEGMLPGQFYSYEGLQTPGAPMFFSVYFLATGLHALHVVIGMAVLIWVTVLTVKGRFSPVYYTPVELGGLYWHLVDLVWIFLFPLLYLV